MSLPEFEYYNPETIDEVFSFLSSLGNKAKVLAGGTDLIPEIKEGLRKVEAFISLKKVKGLKGISLIENEKLTIGALTTLAELIDSAKIPAEFSPLKDAAFTMASPSIRSIATIGGNLVSAVPSADMPPILIAMKARVLLIRQADSRTFPLEEFFIGPRETVLRQDEILKSIEVPVPESGNGACYLKQGKRGCLACAVTGVAVSLTIKDGICQTARIVLGAVAEIPLLVKEASEALIGQKLDRKNIQEASKIAARRCSPITDIRASADYRRDLVEVLTRRAIEKVKKNLMKES